MSLFVVKSPRRSYTREEVQLFLQGSENPYFEPLRGREGEARAWLDSVSSDELRVTSGGNGTHGTHDASLDLSDDRG